MEPKHLKHCGCPGIEGWTQSLDTVMMQKLRPAVDAAADHNSRLAVSYFFPSRSLYPVEAVL
jgi:hypothetical protein